MARRASRTEKTPPGLPGEWRGRLEHIHKQLLDGMDELIDKKNYSEAERLLHIVDKLMLELIKDARGFVAKSE
jgi:hypothetical protein